MATVVFYDESFPYEGKRPEIEKFNGMTLVNAEQLAEALAGEEVTSFVHLHGPYFPKAAWTSILGYLRKGRGLLYSGGAPFRIPVSRKCGEWEPAKAMTAYHQQLNIHEVLPVKSGPIKHLEANADFGIMDTKEKLFTIEDTLNFIMHPTRAKDIASENGSAGPMDCHISPLLKGVSVDNRDVAAPVVLIENTRGEFSGSRWLFINQPLGHAFWNNEGYQTLKEWADYCDNGVTEIWVKPSFASYYSNEGPSLTLQYQGLSRQTSASEAKWSFTVHVSHEDAPDAGWSSEIDITIGAGYGTQSIAVPIEVEPGFYHVRVAALSSRGEKRYFHQGFWGFDHQLLSKGTPVTHDRDYFRKDNQPYPVIGMTYMTSDVARKYLFLPNADAWDKDMKIMADAGINWIRTGLWTGWRQMMFGDGHPSEEVLRAIDAFVLTAKKYNLELTFNFFSFTPELWEGENPYLDPRSVEAQKRFILSVVNRYKDATNIQWDLINEPSLFDPSRIFSGPRGSHDRFEREAWKKWLEERHHSVEALQDHWNMTPEELPNFESAPIPEQHEISFDVEDMKAFKRSTRWLDYTLFTMEIHNVWAKQLVESIRTAAPSQLVTVGQDEALGRGPRPSPFFYAEAVDYTTVHTWWLNDFLVWDGLFGKAPDKPSLIQETGVMYAEQPNNFAKRTEEEIYHLVERKYAYAFSTGSAGAIQWLWNTNYFMDNVNESNIGAVRADGTQKPEADVSYDFGTFFKKAGGILEGRQLEDVAVIFPYSNDFSSRRLAFDATTQATRVLTYDLKIPFRGLSEYHLEDLSENPPKLILVPSPHNFSEEAFGKLITFINECGGTLLFTGPIDLDAYWAETDRLTDLIGTHTAKQTALANVVREESLHLEGTVYPVAFGQRKIAELNKEVWRNAEEPRATEMKEITVGKGKLVWCPLPLELSEHTDVLKAVYTHMVNAAGVRQDMKWNAGGELPGVYGRKLKFNEGNLFTFVSESSQDVTVEVEDPESSQCYSFNLEKERSVLFATDTDGELLATYKEQPIQVKTRTV